MDLSLWKAPARSRLEMLTSSRVNKESRRMGFDMEIKLQLAKWIWADMDLNVAWNEAQFDTESRLFDETAPLSELHYTPGNPFNVQLGLTFEF